VKRLSNCFHGVKFLFVATLLGGSLGLATQTPLWAQSEPKITAQVAPAEVKTLAVVAMNSYDEIVSDVNFAGSLADRPETGQMIDGMISLFTQGKGLVGVDKSKPWGVVVQTDGLQMMPIGCLPVTSLDQLLSIGVPFGLQVTENSDGIKVITLPNQQTIYAKAKDGWAFVSMSADTLAYAPANPMALLSKLVADYDMAAQISIQNAPEMYRQQAISALQAGLKEGLEQKPDESDEQFQARQKLAEGQMDQIVKMIKEVDDVTIGWAIDSQQQRAFADFTYRFLPDSKMAKQLSSYGQPQTNFAGFYKSDAALTLSFASKTDPDLIKDDVDQIRASMQTVRQQVMKALDEENEFPDDATRDAVKAAMNDVMDALEATASAGQMDGGASLQLQPDKCTVVAGMLVKSPEKIESALKKLSDVAEKDPDFPGIQWNAASHAGVNFHTLQVPVPEGEKNARRLFGEKVNVAVGIGPESVYFAVGPDYLEAINQAIDASAADPNKEVPPFEVSFSLGPIMAVSAAYEEDAKQKQVAQTIADMLQGEAQGRDHVRMVGHFIPNGLRYRIEAEEGVLRAIGKAAAEAQEQAQQQAQ
jgi:hypothetical protein